MGNTHPSHPSSPNSRNTEPIDSFTSIPSERRPSQASIQADQHYSSTPSSSSFQNSLSILSQKPLPQGWEARTDNYGRTYFLDHNHRRTTFVDPRVPPCWEMQLDTHGRPYFIDHTNKVTTWQDPRLLSGWEIQLDSNGRPYYIDHTSKRTTYTDPRLLLESQSLPPGWEVRMDPQGKLVYIDHASKVTTYERPKPKEEHKQSTELDQQIKDSVPVSPEYSDAEKKRTCTYFVNRNSKIRR